MNILKTSLTSYVILFLFTIKIYAMHETPAQLYTDFAKSAYEFTQAVQSNNQASLRLRKDLKEYKKIAKLKKKREKQSCLCCDSCLLW